jgi:hypothetical protein
MGETTPPYVFPSLQTPKKGDFLSPLLTPMLLPGG